MNRFTRATGVVTAAASVVALMQYGIATHAQDATLTCRPPQFIPLSATEPAPRIVVDAPLAEPLAARGVAVIPYCANNMRMSPVFGPGALTVSPRVGHIHVTVDDTPWHWADASGNPVIVQGLLPGSHKILIELADADHHVVDRSTVTFVVPASVRTASRPPQ